LPALPLQQSGADYTKYREIFRKRMKQKEEGSVQRHFGAAAREIENLRKQKQRPNPRPHLRHSRSRSPAKTPTTKGKKWKTLCGLPPCEGASGRRNGPAYLEAFQQFVRQKTGDLKKQQSAREIEFIVTVEGKTRASQGAR